MTTDEAPEAEEEDEEMTAARSLKRRSFQKLVKKVVHTQATARVVDHRRQNSQFKDCCVFIVSAN